MPSTPTSWPRRSGTVSHGGRRFADPTLIDVDEVIAELERCRRSRLHNVPALAAIGEARAALPDVPHVAVFDIAFHATIGEHAATWCRAAGAMNGRSPLRVPRHRGAWSLPSYRSIGSSRHLGGGCSVDGCPEGSISGHDDGVQPTEGVPMATRSGSIDPAVLPICREHGLSPRRPRGLPSTSGPIALGGLDDERDSGSTRTGSPPWSRWRWRRRTGRPRVRRCRREPGRRPSCDRRAARAPG